MPTRKQILQAIYQLMVSDPQRDYPSEELLSVASGLIGQNHSRTDAIEILCDILEALRLKDAILIIKGGMPVDILLTQYSFNEWSVRITDRGLQICSTLITAEQEI